MTSPEDEKMLKDARRSPPWVRRCEAHEKAKAAGEKRYHGKPCPRCGGTERYTRNRSCVACAARRNREWQEANRGHRARKRRETRMIKKTVDDDPRRRAEAEGRATYEGWPCSRCGHTERYTNNRQCVHCQRAYMRARREAAREHAEATGQTTYEGRPCYRCGGTTRLTKSGECVNYRKRYEAERYRRKSPRVQAKKAGHKTYESPTSCKRCGGLIRWTKTKRCATCHPEDGDL
jgi:hypothetical protein